jgi:hypothetical protein
MKQFFVNPRSNKAAIILASMAPDMVEDIVELVMDRGRRLVNDVSDPDGPPKPLAIFSRGYMADSDFPEVYVGYSTVQLASLRTLTSDFDFYEKTLMQAFSLPKPMATAMAKTIETYDVLGGLPENDKRAWYTKIGQRVQEEIRRSANWAASVLQTGLENDQDQKWDVDYLFELRNLGKGVNELQSRARLMTGQAAIQVNTNLLGNQGMGDIESGDPDFDSTVAIGDTFAPLMGEPVPPSIFGGLRQAAFIGRAASVANAQRLLSHAGLSQDKTKAQGPTNPVLRNAFDKIVNAKPGKLALLAGGAAFAPFAVKAASSLIKANRAAKQNGDVEDQIREDFGDVFADALANGDVESLIEHIGDLAGPIESTGDPNLDQAIIGDVLGEIVEEGGDPEDSSEIGGLIKRMRINAAIRKGTRRKGRSNRRTGKRRSHIAENDRLIAAREFRDSAGNDPYEEENSQSTEYEDAGTNSNPVNDGQYETVDFSNIQ